MDLEWQKRKMALLTAMSRLKLALSSFWPALTKHWGKYDINICYRRGCNHQLLHLNQMFPKLLQDNCTKACLGVWSLQVPECSTQESGPAVIAPSAKGTQSYCETWAWSVSASNRLLWTWGSHNFHVPQILYQETSTTITSYLVFSVSLMFVKTSLDL